MQSASVFAGTALPSADVIRLPVRAQPADRVAQDAGSVRSYGRDQEIFGEGDPADYFYEVLSGAVRTYKLLGDGRRHIDAFHLPGDIFGIEVGGQHRFSAEVLRDATLRPIRRRGLDTLAFSDPSMARRVMSAMAKSLERAQDHMLLLGRKCAREKIASFLLGLAERVSTHKTIDLPMSRNDIADHLGLTIETVSRTLTKLRRDRLIDLPSSRRVIVLRNTTALRQLHAGDVDERPTRCRPRVAEATDCPTG